MEISLTANIDKAITALAKKPEDIKRAARKGVRAGARVIFDEDRRQVNVIYARPIPVSKGKRIKGGGRGKPKPLWERKHTLRLGEHIEYPNPLMALITEKTNDTPYAVARHALNRPGAGGVTRHDPWREKTVQAVGQASVNEFERVFSEELKK